MSRKASKLTAFTILELSLVLAIVGFLFSSYIIYDNVIESANNNKLISEINKIKKAVEEFEGKYASLPGDVADEGLEATYNNGSPLVGNGNGIIDNSSVHEELYFWVHLSAAGLYQGTYSGLVADQYKTSANNRIGAVPQSPFRDSGIRVIPSSLKGVELEVSKYSSSSNSLALFTPREAANFDKKYDDGNPTSGYITAVDASDVVPGSCINSGSYNLSNTNKACVLRFVIKPNIVNYSGDVAPTCNGLPLGTTRQSATDHCPVGYTGRVIEECILVNSTTASFVNTKKLCEPVKCSFGLNSGETMQLPCPDGWTGTVTTTCKATGVLSYDSSGCATTNSVGSDYCKALEGARPNVRTLSCPLGQIGSVLQICTTSSNTWATTYSSCSNLTCSATAIGSASGNDLGCNNVNYTQGSTALDIVEEVCTMASGYSASGVVNDNTLTVAPSDVCMPSYTGSPCSLGSTRNIGCPNGHSGVHIQECVTNGGGIGYYATQTNTCAPATCDDGSPIGTAKISNKFKCLDNQVGIAYEVCELDSSAGIWKASYRNCSYRHCPSAYDDGAGNAGLGTYNAGNTAYKANAEHSASSCANSLYSNNSASRRCGLDGYWYARNTSCSPNKLCTMIDETQSNYSQSIWSTRTISTPSGGFLPSGVVSGSSQGIIPPEHGEYFITTLSDPGFDTTQESYCYQSDMSPPTIRRELQYSMKLICNSAGHWVDFCSTSNATDLTSSANNETRISAISAKTNTYISSILCDESGNAINYCSDINGDNYYSSSANSSEQVCAVCFDSICSW